MRKVFLGVITLMTMTLCHGQNSYKIDGDISGFDNGTWLYLSDVTNGTFQDIDSVQIENNKFHLKGKLPNNPTEFGLHTKDFQDYTIFWVENSPLQISLKQGEFREAQISGSPTETLNRQYYEELEKSEDKTIYTLNFIKNHPGSILSAVHLSLAIREKKLSKKQIAQALKALSPSIQESLYGKRVSQYLKLNQNPQIGQRFIDFSEKNLNGHEISLSSYKGKITLLDFWGTWCGPCIKEMPNLVSTYNEFHEKGFEILGVAADIDAETVKKVLKKFHVTWENVSELQGDRDPAVIIYGVNYFPANFLIDKDGTIIARDLRGDALKEKLKELL